jgi:glycosyltransferase involved in cell wall biosynthesis
MTDGTVAVSVLTPVLNEEEHLREVVARMSEQDIGAPVEFLFVDGGSADGTRAILEDLAAQDPRIRVFDNPKRHTAAGLNIALAHARGEYVARMDAHSFYPPGYLRVGVERLRRGDVAWVCGPQVPHGRGWWSERVAAALQSRLGVGASNRFDVAGADELPLDTGVFTGVWRTDVVRRFDGWDEGWPINQDSELAARMLAAGERIVSLRAMAADYVPRNRPRALARQYFRYGMYRAKTFRRHRVLRASLLLPPGLVAAVPASLSPARVIRTPARAGLIAYACAVAATGARAAASSRAAADLVGVPAALATMHLCWGAGFLVGLARRWAPAD